MISALSLAIVLLDAGVGAPPWPLSPDGERVATFGDAPLEAEGATVERESASWWRVVPDAGRERVRLRAGPSVVEALVAPPAGSIAVTADPPVPVKGRDARVRIRLEARGADGEPLRLESPPRVVASVGTLGPFSAAGAPGVFEATWQPSDSPQPEVLGLVAIAPRCPLCATPLALGVARFPISAAIDLPGRSDPGVETRVEIAGRVWGPVRADGEGRFRVPAVVPPGARWALATSLNARGNATHTKLDLHLPEEPGLTCALWPERVPADGRTEAGIVCAAWTAGGAMLDARPIRASVGRGALQVMAAGDTWYARYRPPVGGAGAERISVGWGALPRLAQTLSIALSTGAPASIDWAPEGEPVLPGEKVRVRARAYDAHGDSLGDASAVDGAIEGGYVRARRELGDGLQPVTLTFSLPQGVAAASLSLHREDGQWVAVARDVAARPVPGISVRFGAGSAGVTDSRGEARVLARGSVETVEGPSGLRAIGWAAAPAAIPPLSVSRDVRLSLRPPGTLDVEAVVRDGWIRWKIRAPDGAALGGRAVTVVSETVRIGPIEPDGEGARSQVLGGKGVVAITDSDSGATAILELR